MGRDFTPEEKKAYLKVVKEGGRRICPFCKNEAKLDDADMDYTETPPTNDLYFECDKCPAEFPTRWIEEYGIVNLYFESFPGEEFNPIKEDK